MAIADTPPRPQTISGRYPAQLIIRSWIESTLWKEKNMGDVVYVSKSRIERRDGPLRIAHLPGVSQPLPYSVHGAISEHYNVDPAKLKESHSSTIHSAISAPP